MIVLYCIICGSQSYIRFKISASGLFLKCSKNFENFNLDILVKHIKRKKTKKERKSLMMFLYFVEAWTKMETLTN